MRARSTASVRVCSGRAAPSAPDYEQRLTRTTGTRCERVTGSIELRPSRGSNVAVFLGRQMEAEKSPVYQGRRCNSHNSVELKVELVGAYSNKALQSQNLRDLREQIPEIRIRVVSTAKKGRQKQKRLNPAQLEGLAHDYRSG